MDVRAAHQTDEHRALHLVVGEDPGQEAGNQLLHQHEPLPLAG